MNIILVIFDTLRKDCIGAYGQPPWGKVHTPNLDRFAEASLVFDRVYPEVLPTLPARRAIYTGKRVYPFHESMFYLKGDFTGSPGWGPIPESDDTLAELLREKGGYRTGLISDVYHQFKPSKNFQRGFDQWQFLRGQEVDPYRSGPEPTQEEIDYWLAREYQSPENWHNFIRQCIKNMHDRNAEEDYFNARVMTEASHWLRQNRAAENFFLTVESFDPHEPWFVPENYRKMYDKSERQEQVASLYRESDDIPVALIERAQANYSALVTMCDRWFGHFYETLRVQGLLENSVVIVATDHGHSIGDANYMGKRGYPSHPSVFDIGLMIRHPGGEGAGERSDLLLQHIDISAQILDFANIKPNQPIDGKVFWDTAVKGGKAIRDHVTIAWDCAITVVKDHWWMNCNVDGSGVFLYDLAADPQLNKNVADEHPAIVKELFTIARADADNSIPEYLIERAIAQSNAPGCSAIAANK